MSEPLGLYAAVVRVRHDVATRAQGHRIAAVHAARDADEAARGRALAAEAEAVLAALDAILTDFAPARIAREDAAGGGAEDSPLCANCGSPRRPVPAPVLRFGACPDCDWPVAVAVPQR